MPASDDVRQALPRLRRDPQAALPQRRCDVGGRSRRESASYGLAAGPRGRDARAAVEARGLHADGSKMILLERR